MRRHDLRRRKRADIIMRLQRPPEIAVGDDPHEPPPLVNDARRSEGMLCHRDDNVAQRIARPHPCNFRTGMH